MKRLLLAIALLSAGCLEPADETKTVKLVDARTADVNDITTSTGDHTNLEKRLAALEAKASALEKKLATLPATGSTVFNTYNNAVTYTSTSSKYVYGGQSRLWEVAGSFLNSDGHLVHIKKLSDDYSVGFRIVGGYLEDQTPVATEWYDDTTCTGHKYLSLPPANLTAAVYKAETPNGTKYIAPAQRYNSVSVYSYWGGGGCNVWSATVAMNEEGWSTDALDYAAPVTVGP